MNRLAHRSLRLAAALLALAAPTAAQARTIPVSNGPAFHRAIAAAQPGDVIQLAGVTFPQLLIRRRAFNGTVRITGTPATHLEGVVIKDSKNTQVDDVTGTPAGD